MCWRPNRVSDISCRPSMTNAIVEKVHALKLLDLEINYHVLCESLAAHRSIYLLKVSIRTASRKVTRLAVCRVSRVRVRVSEPGQPCVSTSNGYTHGYGRS